MRIAIIAALPGELKPLVKRLEASGYPASEAVSKWTARYGDAELDRRLRGDGRGRCDASVCICGVRWRA